MTQTSPSSRSRRRRPRRRPCPTTETQMLFPVVAEAIERSGLRREEIGFTCSGSADYLAGQPFAFVGNLEATGAWPPISESHVEMDGAWALYEAWVRLQHGDVDSALVFSSGISSRGDLREVLCLQNDPYYLMPLWADHVSLAALQARAVLEPPGKARARPGRGRRPLPPQRAGQPVRPGVRRRHGRRPAGRAATSVAPLRAGDCPPVTDGAAAVVLVAGDRAREVCERPGLDPRHRPPHRAALPGRARPDRRASRPGWPARHAGVGDAAGRGGRAVRHVQPRGADPAGRARPRRRRRRQPVGRPAGRQPGDGHRASPASARRSEQIHERARTARSATPRRARACSRTSSASWKGTS